jgi:hypothetical protein
MVHNSIADYICNHFEQAPAKVRYYASLSDHLFARQFGERKHCFLPNIWTKENRVKLIITTTAPIGCRYDSFVRGGAVKNGAAEKKKDVDYNGGGSWHVRSNEYGKLFECHKNDAAKLYLRIQFTEAQKDCGLATNSALWVITVGEKEIILTEKEVKDCTETIEGVTYRFGDFLKPTEEKKATKPQIEAGVSEDNPINYFCPSIDNILSIEQEQNIKGKKITEKWVR